MNLSHLRHYAIARTLFPSTDLDAVLGRIGFIQIDPITAPAWAQDLILRHRVTDYRRGDMDRAYPSLASEEVFFVNHGYLPRTLAQSWWHQRPITERMVTHAAMTHKILGYIKTHAPNEGAHPKTINAYIGNEKVTNYWNGTSHAGTQLLQHLHAQGVLRIVRREKGIRIYGLPHPPTPQPSLERIVEQAFDTLLQTYAPIPNQSMAYLARLLANSRPDLKIQIQHALRHLEERYAHITIEGERWYWPAHEHPEQLMRSDEDKVYLLAPFDPLVWDRTRFTRFWGWEYKFEAYKPAHARKLGYYALPLLWRDMCIGWANLSVIDAQLHAHIGYIDKKPREKAHRIALEQELAQCAAFLGCTTWHIHPHTT